jgi:hypothetical protein
MVGTGAAISWKRGQQRRWPGSKRRNTMSATDTKNVSLFTSVRRSRGHEVAVAGALLIAAYLGVASVLIDTYQRPDIATVMAGG